MDLVKLVLEVLSKDLGRFQIPVDGNAFRSGVVQAVFPSAECELKAVGVECEDALPDLSEGWSLERMCFSI